MKNMTQKDKTKEELIEEIRLLQKRIADTEQIVLGGGTYAESIVETIREPLIVLGDDLKIISANHSFYQTFKVTPEETQGRFIYDLGNKQWDIPKLRELLETILPQKTTFNNYEVEHDFATIGRRVILLNARQIERVAGKERIILLAIEDITERKEIEAGLEKTRKELAVIKQSADEAGEFAESIINTVREPLIALDQDLRVVKVNRSFYEFFKVKPEDTVGQLIYDLGNKQWDVPKLRELLETILPQKTTFDNYEVEYDFPTIGRRVMLLNARRIYRETNKTQTILLAIEDITERRKAEELVITNEELVVQNKEKEKRVAELTAANKEIVRLNKVFLAKVGIRWIGAMWAAMAIIIVVGGMWFFKTLISDSEKESLEMLASIAKFKVSAIEDWRFERMSDARVLTGSLYLIQKIQAWMASPTAEDTDDLIKRFRLTQENYRYYNILLVDTAGNTLINARLPGTRESLPKDTLLAMESAVRDHKPVMTDLYIDPVTGKHRLDVVVPFYSHVAEKDKFIAAAVLTRDPEIFLYPMLQAWPIPSKSAETYLVRREGNSVLWLNNVRFYPDAALKMKQSLALLERPAVQVVLGKRGVFYGVDYRGKRVVSFLTALPDSSWCMVSKVDADEIFAGIRFKLALYYVMVAVLLAAALISTFAMRQRAAFFKGLYEKDEAIHSYASRLEVANKELGAFSYSVSHDLKAPLRAMAGFSNILSEEYAPKLDDNGRRLIGVINDNARIMEQLIDDLLKLAYMARQALDVVDIDVTALVQSVCHELREELFRDRAIEVSVKPLPAARADHTLAKQIFTNLISNAMKFTAHKDKAVIEIGGYDKDGERIYYIKDNGAGFDMKYADKLFGVFQRLHTQDEFSGTGIGLAIVSNAVRRHGGKVWAEAEVGQGATFYFTLTKGEQNEQL